MISYAPLGAGSEVQYCGLQAGAQSEALSRRAKLTRARPRSCRPARRPPPGWPLRTARKGGVSAANAVETQSNDCVLATEAVETHGKGDVLATEAVETQGKGGVLAMEAVGTRGKGGVVTCEESGGQQGV